MERDIEIGDRVRTNGYPDKMGTVEDIDKRSHVNKSWMDHYYILWDGDKAATTWTIDYIKLIHEEYQIY